MSMDGRLEFGDCNKCGKEETVVSLGSCASCSASIKCKNHSFCGATGPVMYIVFCHGGFCIGCNVTCSKTPFYRTPLQFRAGDANEPCCVCSGSDLDMMQFPAEGCTHWFCIQCSRDIILFDESRYHLDPRAFGCPPCPNGCDNPAQGPQCECIEYDDVQDAWRTMHPEEYLEWDESMSVNIERPRPETCFGSKACPLCRRKSLI